ncbi:MAG: CRISPR system precrRNA processing endoribonuclease RAMP protein Cas6 [Candidatus Marinimicrobia bacterium]|nr:CRISPR system precrRNA processing endoribonuclease RAMP protein Cas6 [Candidatus Neomarinimicrobiota bacterium]
MIDVLKLTFNLKCLDDIALPRFAPATIRGAFGIRLKRTACTQMRHGGICKSCLLKNACIYSYIFENHFQVEGRPLDIAEPPHPYLLMVQLNQKPVIYPKGSNIQWHLNLFGSRISEILPYIVLTAERMGNAGLGRDRGKFFIDNIIAFQNNDAIVIYHHVNKNLKMPLPIQRLDINGAHDTAEKIRLRFNTPTRIQHGGNILHEISFKDIIVNIFRRYSLLVKYYQKNSPKIEVDQDLLNEASKIQTIESNFEWKVYARYSARQKRKMVLGGITGELLVAGELGPFIPLLDIGRLINIGKNTSFGFGNFDYTIEK